MRMRESCAFTAYDGDAVEAVDDPVALRSSLLDWYAGNGRRLSFRRSREPWGVLVSEVMLQQTQVARVEPAWSAFVARFPSPAALAAATPADALRAWGGLGYNRRALNLWRAAAVIVERHAGAVPRTLEELRALPGVGGYTARAVAAIAFGQPVAAVDTNVRRVIGRVRWGVAPAPSTEALQAVADTLVHPLRPDAWTHAVMDVGATLCRPRNPECGACPLHGLCAYAASAAGQRTVRAPVSPVSPGPSVRPAGTRTAAVPFPRSMRWLRGRIVDRLRNAQPGDWVDFDAPLGDHGLESVLAAVDALAAEGLLERGELGGVRLALAYGART